MKVTGVILAGGKSSRVGSHKAILPYKGKVMLNYAIDSLKPLCSEILISISKQDTHEYSYPTIVDEFNEIGPISGLYSALTCSSNEYVLCLSCDVPNVTVESLKILLNNIEGFDAVIPIHSGNKVEPLVACYKKSILEKVTNAIGSNQFKLQELINNLHVNYINFEDSEQFRNINFKSDFE